MLVTVGIPIFNAERTLIPAMRSVYAQTLDDWELLLVDDGSTDASRDIAERVAARDPRVRVAGEGKNRGLVYRLNQIATMARGNYLARMDADDLMHPERLFRQVAYLESNPDIDILGTGLYSIDAENRPLSVHFYEVGDSVIRSLFAHKLIMHPTVMGRTEWFRQHPYDAKYSRAQDQELWARTHRFTKFANIQEALFFYRLLPASDAQALRRRLQLYLESCSMERALYRLYGPEIGRFYSISILCRSYLKEVVYRIAGRLGMQNTLRLLMTRSRFPKLNAMQQASASATLQQIFATEIPGLDRETNPASFVDASMRPKLLSGQIDFYAYDN